MCWRSCSCWPAVWRCRTSYLFLLPTFLALILFSYYPIVYAFTHAFTEWRGNGDSAWTGLANFQELFRDDVMGASAQNALILLLAQVVITLTVNEQNVWTAAVIRFGAIDKLVWRIVDPMCS